MSWFYTTIVKATMVTTTFDLLMSQGGFDTFSLTINYIFYYKWPYYHVIVGIFEFHKTLEVSIIMQLKDLFVHFYLYDKVITYVKDESGNLLIPSSLL
jgi:hypothetical protein